MMSFQKITRKPVKVSLSVHEGNSVIFAVNGNFDMLENNEHKVAISRWLLKTWKQLLETEVPYLVCLSHKEDGFGEYREGIYAKLGFKRVGTSTKFLWVRNEDDRETVINTL